MLHTAKSSWQIPAGKATFAVCLFSGPRQRLCRVLHEPTAKTKHRVTALNGHSRLCRVPHGEDGSFAVCHVMPHTAKMPPLPCAGKGVFQNARNDLFAVSLIIAHGKVTIFLCFFCSVTYMVPPIKYSSQVVHIYDNKHHRQFIYNNKHPQPQAIQVHIKIS